MHMKVGEQMFAWAEMLLFFITTFCRAFKLAYPYWELWEQIWPFPSDPLHQQSVSTHDATRYWVKSTDHLVAGD